MIIKRWDGVYVNPKQPTNTLHIKQQEIATLGGGCFWSLEAVFSEIRGVEKVESGYSGGNLENPTYHQVSTGKTGHAEVVQITFNPNAISFTEILEIFFTAHNPTTLNQQGADVGPQYRSVILYHTPEQIQIAEHLIKTLNTAKIWNAPIVTQIQPFNVFYKAEAYHQEYFQHNPNQPYCRFIIAPKITKMRKSYREKLKNR